MYQTSEQGKANNKVAENQQTNINKATVDNYAMLNRQGVEDAQNATEEGDRINRERASRIASAKAAAAGSGVEGLSVDALLLDLSGKGLKAGTTSEMNYARMQEARTDQTNAVQSRADSEMSQLKFSPGLGVADYLGAGLKIGDAYYTDKAAKAAAVKGAR